MSSKWRITFLESKCERIYKDRGKHFVVLHEWNQGNCTNTSRAKYRSWLEKYETENPRPTTWWSVNGNRPTIQKLQGKWRPHNSERLPSVQEKFSTPKQRGNEVLRRLHGQFGKPPGIAKTIIAYREKHYLPRMAQLIRDWVMSCKQWIKESRIGRSVTCPTL